uniref:C2H2-type domain-containing protein n=1 Tax=Nelumbo nucifera TaxID=4432 RepID=A0A822YFP5_NELNU|nr:TPA_asm: hypothetical protein HUJ06_010221 [Nelumbo nucifera]
MNLQLVESHLSHGSLREETTIKEETKESIRENIMPLELAIKRELAYRRKIQSLRLHPSNISKEAPATSKKPQCSPPQQSQPSYSYQLRNLFCKVCQVQFSSALSLKQHRQGSEHKAKQKELEEKRKDGGGKGSQQLWCKLCSVPCSNEICFKQHLRGKKHAAQLEALQKEKKTREEETEAAMVKWSAELEWETFG